MGRLIVFLAELTLDLILQDGDEYTVATGITERGSICQFNMSFNVLFEPGAGIVPNHGGFLMCGKNADSKSPSIGLFMVSFIYPFYR